MDKNTYLEDIHSKSIDGVYHMGRINNFSFGFVKYAAKKKEKLYTSKNQENIQFLQLNTMLRKLNSQQLPYHKFLDIIEQFGDRLMALYCYGNKTPLSNFNLNMDAIADKGVLEIAIACEFKLPGYFVSTKYIDSNKGKYYSNFNSNTSSNYQVVSNRKLHTVNPEIFRMTIYNTFQHKKKNFMEKLNIKDVIDNSQKDNQSTFTYLKKSILFNFDEFSRIMDCSKETSLRKEIYFLYNNQESFEKCVEEIRVLDTKDMMYVKTFDVDIELYLTEIFDNFIVLLDGTKRKHSIDMEILIIVLYYKIYAGIFTLEVINDDFKKNNYGIGISSTCWDSRNNTLTAEFFKMFNLETYVQILKTIFHRTKANDDLVSYYLLTYLNILVQYEFLSCVEPSSVVNIVVNYLLKSSEKTKFTLEDENAQKIDINKYLEFFGKKLNKLNSSVFKKNSHILLLELLTNGSIYDSVMDELEHHQLLIYFKQKVYLVKKFEVIDEVAVQFNIDNLYSFTNHFKKYFIDSCELPIEDLSFDSVFFSDFMNHFKEEFIERFPMLIQNQNIVQKLIYDKDDDFWYRIIFGNFILESLTEINCLCIPMMFTSVDWFFKFVVLGMHVSQNIGTMKVSEHFIGSLVNGLRDHISKKTEFNPKQLLLFTGLFVAHDSFDKFIHNNSRITMHVPMKVKFSRYLPEGQRLKFCKAGYHLEIKTKCLKEVLSIEEIAIKRKRLSDKMLQIKDEHYFENSYELRNVENTTMTQNGISTIQYNTLVNLPNSDNIDTSVTSNINFPMSQNRIDYAINSSQKPYVRENPVQEDYYREYGEIIKTPTKNTASKINRMKYVSSSKILPFNDSISQWERDDFILPTLDYKKEIDSSLLCHKKDNNINSSITDAAFIKEEKVPAQQLSPIIKKSNASTAISLEKIWSENLALTKFQAQLISLDLKISDFLEDTEDTEIMILDLLQINPKSAKQIVHLTQSSIRKIMK